ncbi:MAG: hypothetical protein ABI680_02770, partial [Chthoniobacteraceae bacterium]
VASFGLSLVWMGLVTHWFVTSLGVVCLLSGLVGWFREVLPRESHEDVAIEPEPAAVEIPSPEVRHLRVGEQGHRATLPLAIYPYSAGLRGGIAGGLAMIVPALIYGLIFHHSLWYPVNLLAAAGSATISAMSYDQLRAFSFLGLVLGTIIHVAGSLLVGLLYGIALPMYPRRPILVGGILAPLFWSGLLHSAMGIINPTLQARVDWWWFILAQIVFGVVCGIVVSKRERIFTLQHVPFAERIGLEGSGLSEKKEDEK